MYNLLLFTLQRIYDASREKVSELGRALEIEASTSITGGINLDEAKKAMEEEDKYDKELFRQRIKAKHREDRLKAKAERRLANRVEKEEEEENVDGEEDEESGDDESVDGSVADIIDALPDPDRIYGAKVLYFKLFFFFFLFHNPNFDLI